MRAMLILRPRFSDTPKADYCDGGWRLKKEKNECKFLFNRTSSMISLNPQSQRYD
jgi:hypothetical protein